MKKIYFSLITIAILLCTACTNDVPGNEKVKETGTLTATISFGTGSSLKATRAAESTAIPTVTWDNVKQVQLFLYDATSGLVTYTKTITPKSGDASFVYSWPDVPVGTYRLALLANVKSGTDQDQIDTWVGAGALPTEFSENVLGKKFNPTYITNRENDDLQIDLRKTTLPGEETTPAIHNWKHSDLTKTGYLPPSEIFSAYSENVTITAGEKTELTGDNKLTLLHEVSLLRARINRKTIPAQPDDAIQPPVHNTSSGFIAVQTLPVGLGLKVDNFDGGIFTAPSSKGRVLVGSTGTTTYQTVQPTTGYKEGGTIIGGDFELWQDIRVLPNAPVSLNIAKDGDAPVGRKYFIIISMVVQPGYIYATGEIATKTDQPVYWYGEISGVFTRNVIREVNMTLKTAGYPEIPPTPVEYGGLTIELGAPMEWDATIERTDIES